MAEQERPMGGLHAHITRKALRTDTAGAVHGFRTGPNGGRLLCLWPSTVEAAFFGGSADEARG